MNYIGTAFTCTGLIIISLAGIGNLISGGSLVSYFTCILGIVVLFTGLGILGRKLIAEIIGLNGDAGSIDN